VLVQVGYQVLVLGSEAVRKSSAARAAHRELRCRAENKASASAALPCGSGFSREESNAVHGTGYAGVRG